MKTATAVLVAAGASRRMGFDKLACCVRGKPVLQHSIEAFDTHPLIGELVLVTGPDDSLARRLAARCKKPVRLVRGGATRAESAAAGVRAATGELVAIHDAARPFVTPELIAAALRAADAIGAAAPAVPVKDTIKIAAEAAGKIASDAAAEPPAAGKSAADAAAAAKIAAPAAKTVASAPPAPAAEPAAAPAPRLVRSTPPRASLYAVQTPQCFARKTYLALLEAAGRTGQLPALTDDCQLFEQAGLPVALTPGSYANQKITTIEDLKGESSMRIGHGYDVHQLVEGRKLILGGVEIPYEKGLLGHSDADVLTHAVMDALLGAAALGDIGQHFPDSDPAYKGADSLALARAVRQKLAEAGWRLGNLDATILCQAPKLAPHIPAMRQNLAEALAVPPEQVSVKATTEEHLGFTGAGQGIAAHAVALIERAGAE